MTISNKNLTPPLSHNGFWANLKHRRLVYALLGLAPVGFLDASFLTAEHYLHRIPPCSIIHGCEKVTTSSYALIFGVPMALLGAIYYLAIILGLVYFLDSKNSLALKWVARFTACGFLFSLWLVYLQLFVIGAICQWCMLSAASSIGLFIFGMMVLKSHRDYELETNVTQGL